MKNLRELIDNAWEESENADAESENAPDVGDQERSDLPEDKPSLEESAAEDTQAGESDENAEGVRPDKDAQEGAVLEPPVHWSAADKESFKKAPADVQEWALRRDRDMTADYTRKTTEIADFRKTWGPVHEMFAPHIAQGTNPAPLIQSWAQVASQLQQNPRQAIEQLAKQYGVDLTPPKTDDIWGSADQKPATIQDPRVGELQQQLQMVTGHLQQRDQLDKQLKQQTFENQIRDFAEKKTETGDPANPYFEELIPDMMQLAQAVQAAGQEPQINELYDRALWANPSTREKTLASQRAAAEKKAQDEAIAKAKKAKQAGKSVGGSSVDTAAPAKKSLREELESHFD